MLKRTALVALPAIALLMGGCANTAQLKQDIGKAQQTADGAQKSADEAKRMAQDAKRTADRANDAAMHAQADAAEAKRMAGQAQQDAAAAKSAADAANEKADRMFKKAMSKYHCRYGAAVTASRSYREGDESRGGVGLSGFFFSDCPYLAPGRSCNVAMRPTA